MSVDLKLARGRTASRPGPRADRGDDLAAYPDRNWADFYFKPAAQQNHYFKLKKATDK